MQPDNMQQGLMEKKIEFRKQNNINRIIFTAGESHYNSENSHLRVFDMMISK